MTLDTKTTSNPKCSACNGRGWIPGDCHPCEVCGICNGFGDIDPTRHPDDAFDGNRVRREPTHISALLTRPGL